jgi:hypothetical protein
VHFDSSKADWAIVHQEILMFDDGGVAATTPSLPHEAAQFEGYRFEGNVIHHWCQQYNKTILWPQTKSHETSC